MIVNVSKGGEPSIQSLINITKNAYETIINQQILELITNATVIANLKLENAELKKENEDFKKEEVENIEVQIKNNLK